uniref:(northern house mosquito) hypothetical protein n=1 Tax=Culex pipiens TaxID=7175 RepID=A0A8D8KFR8_CULPI
MSFRRRLGFGHRQTSLPLCANSGSISAGSLRVPRGRCYTPFFSLSIVLCVPKTQQNDTKRCCSFSSFFHFRKFCFLLHTQQQPNWKITPGCNAYTTLFVTRNDTRKITCIFFLSPECTFNTPFLYSQTPF